MKSINTVPRRIAGKTQLDYALGHPLTLLGAIATSLGAMVFWLILAGYGIALPDLLGRQWSEDFYTAKVESSNTVRLWTGEPAPQMTALFEYQGKTYRATGYGVGSDKVELGSSVSVHIAGENPHRTRIAGFQEHPIDLDSLARITAVLLAPGLILGFLGLVLGFRQLRVLKTGIARTVTAKRRLPLPRPLKGSYLVQWTGGTEHLPENFWSVVFGEAKKSQALLGGSRWIGALLACPTMEQQLEESQCFEDPNKGRRRRRWGVLLLVLIQLFIGALFLGT